ncbi:MAG: 16S rRNA (guanine(527)-N(7))-methyltransferase RsmG [Bacteroidetes bacterium HGW-Bacteroidetes-6]|jgi:16S rRNA (guanine527-N7)-methyltransferase|nr:MAG: 16S rRNA (guanine(527)-N(7))-methyltransferase RsmG [Bacteroidetes bacterium HGW-Bacteroidetes-6]
MELIYKYFPNLSIEQYRQFTLMGQLYEEWNSRINVISRKDIEHFYERHVLHSLAIAKFFDFPDGIRVLDVGTGGGFPGIPLAVMHPDVNFTLVDSIGKKISVVKEVAYALGLKNIEATQNRVENMNGKFDVIVSRAVTSFPEFTALVKQKLKKQSTFPDILYLKGGEFESELKRMRGTYSVYNINEAINESFFDTKKLLAYYF